MLFLLAGVAGFALRRTIGLGTVLHAATIASFTQWWMRQLPGHVVLVPATSTT
ncbi:unannotated protein [freshwater metagenome]|uniref:Unannotated protein n=1 Tax=freshwater metagenome TaxID=449393 RepID=A0A6J7ASS9_9ZZZZ